MKAPLAPMHLAKHVSIRLIDPKEVLVKMFQENDRFEVGSPTAPSGRANPDGEHKLFALIPHTKYDSNRTFSLTDEDVSCPLSK